MYFYQNKFSIMKRIIILLLFILPFSVFAQQKDYNELITSELKQKMFDISDTELIPVIVILKDKYPTYELRRTYSSMLKEERRNLVIEELKTFSLQSQGDLRSFLEKRASEGQVVVDHYFWITNVVSCKATPDIINQMAKRDDIESIDYDNTSYALFDEEPVSAPNGASGSREITYNVSKVNAPDVWDAGFTGAGVTVAVLDVGVNYNHVDLATHMWENPDYPNHGYDFAYNDDNPMDNHGHGTHCAGTVAGNGTAGSQTGMAPDAIIMAVKVLNDQGGGNETDAWEGIEFAVENGADVLSMSIGWAHSMNPNRSTWRNTLDNALDAGVVASIAAGNDYGTITNPDDVRTPGDCPPPWLNPDQTLTGGISAVVCVGATDSNDNIASFSSKGPSTWESISPYNDYPFNPEMGLLRPDVSAPGVDIKSCDAFNINGYTTMSGTSMATPGVAGVMALLLSKNPNLTPEMIDQFLETTSVDLGAVGKDNMYGAGRIDAFEAFSSVVDIYPPTALNAITDQETGLCTLTWNHNQTEGFEYYRIYRDDVIIDSTTEMALTDQLIEYGYYNYSVKAYYGGTLESEAAVKQTQFGSSMFVANPDSLSTTLFPDAIDELFVIVKNEGVLDLTFSLSPFKSSLSIASWISMSPESATVAVGDSMVVTFTFDAAGMENGLYEEEVVLVTNDIESNTFRIPVTMIVSDLEVDITATANEICYGTFAELESTVSGGSGTYNYLWTSVPEGFVSEEANPVVYPEVTTEYILLVNDGMATVESSVIVSVLESPVVDLGGDQILCGENEIELDAGNSGDIYLWSTDETSQIITASGSGNTMFWAQVTNDNNCSSRDTVYINFAQLPVINLGSDTTICGGETITLDAGNPGSEYLWSTGADGQTYVADTVGYGYGVQNISVEVTSELGCQNNSEIAVDFLDCTSVHEISGIDFSIYPVPSDGMISIKLSGQSNRPLNIMVYDLTGRLIYNIPNIVVTGVTVEKVDLSSVSKGAYNVIVSDGISSVANKVLIK